MPGAGPLLRLAELRKPTAQVLDAPSYAKSAARLRTAIRDARALALPTGPLPA
ncbi:hypothetical protein [Streptomyces halstedii]|uniref:hypothetical protein n=1 Tax=Streptomyces halstedii TaxID=1944 RepID=UPI0038112BB5